MKSQNAAGEIVVEPELAMQVEISLGERSSRIAPLFPDRNGTLDADVIVLCARPHHRFSVDRCAVEPRSLRRIDAAVLLVAGLPFREAKLSPDIVLADNWIVARE